eukprot:gnl/Chilomastix_cuspidata/5770.p1 GENE.gnl/Chilomastix_cuspidata/5770~~gnl/Chilomastix_cuspidata/5770.p1  ORF type:complete len:5601 (+),score=1229.56 gnl/Chilomastix_cuspidata/5770:1668-16805(+)
MTNISLFLYRILESRTHILHTISEALIINQKFQEDFQILEDNGSILNTVGSSSDVTVKSTIQDIKDCKTIIKYTDQILQVFETFSHKFIAFLHLPWVTFVKSASNPSDKTCPYLSFKKYLNRTLTKFIKKGPPIHQVDISKIFRFLEENTHNLRDTIIPNLEKIVYSGIHVKHWTLLSSMCIGAVLPPFSQALLNDFITIDFVTYREQLNHQFEVATYERKIMEKAQNNLERFYSVTIMIIETPKELLPAWISEQTLPKDSSPPLFVHDGYKDILKTIRASLKELDGLLLHNPFASHEKKTPVDIDKVHEMIVSLQKAEELLKSITIFQMKIVELYRLALTNRVDYSARKTQYSPFSFNNLSMVSLNISGNPKHVSLPITRTMNTWECQMIRELSLKQLEHSWTWDLDSITTNNSIFSYAQPSEFFSDRGPTFSEFHEASVDSSKEIRTKTTLTNSECFSLVESAPESLWFPRYYCNRLLTLWNATLTHIRHFNSFYDFIHDTNSIHKRLHECTRLFTNLTQNFEHTYILMQRRFNPHFSLLKNEEIIELLSAPDHITIVPRMEWTQDNLRFSKNGYILEDQELEGNMFHHEPLEEKDELETSVSTNHKYSSDEKEYHALKKKHIAKAAGYIQRLVPGLYSFVFSSNGKQLIGAVLDSDTHSYQKTQAKRHYRTIIFLHPINVAVPTIQYRASWALVSPSIWLPSAIVELRSTLKHMFFKSFESLQLPLRPTPPKYLLTQNVPKSNSKRDREFDHKSQFTVGHQNLIPTCPYSLNYLEKLMDNCPLDVFQWVLVSLHTLQLSAYIIAKAENSSEMWNRYKSLLALVRSYAQKLSGQNKPAFVQVASLADYLFLSATVLKGESAKIAQLLSLFQEFKKDLPKSYLHLTSMMEKSVLDPPERSKDSILFEYYYVLNTFLFARFLTLSSKTTFLSQNTTIPQIFSFPLYHSFGKMPVPSPANSDEDYKIIGEDEFTLPVVDLSFYSLHTVPPELSSSMKRFHNLMKTSRSSTKRTFRSSLSNRTSRSSLLTDRSKQTTRTFRTARSERFLQSTARSDSMQSYSSAGRMNSSRQSSRNFNSINSYEFNLFLEDIDLIFSKITSLGWPLNSFSTGNTAFYVPHVANSLVTNGVFFVRIGASPFFNSFSPSSNQYWVRSFPVNDSFQATSFVPRSVASPNVFTPELMALIKDTLASGFQSIPCLSSPLITCSKQTILRVSKIISSLIGRAMFEIDGEVIKTLSDRIGDLYDPNDFYAYHTVASREHYKQAYHIPLNFLMAFLESTPSLAVFSYDGLDTENKNAMSIRFNEILTRISNDTLAPIQTPFSTFISSNNHQFYTHFLSRDFFPIFWRNTNNTQTIGQMDNLLAPVQLNLCNGAYRPQLNSRHTMYAPLYVQASPYAEPRTAMTSNSDTSKKMFDHKGSVVHSLNSSESHQIHEALGFVDHESISLESFPKDSFIGSSRDLTERLYTITMVYSVLRSMPNFLEDTDFNSLNYLIEISRRIGSLLHFLGFKFISTGSVNENTYEHRVVTVTRIFHDFVFSLKQTSFNVSVSEAILLGVYFSLNATINVEAPLASRIRSRMSSTYVQKQVTGEHQLHQSLGYFTQSNSLTFAEDGDEFFLRIMASVFPEFMFSSSKVQVPVTRLDKSLFVTDNVVTSLSPVLGQSSDPVSFLINHPVSWYPMHPSFTQSISMSFSGFADAFHSRSQAQQAQAFLETNHRELKKSLLSFLDFHPADFSIFNYFVKNCFNYLKKLLSKPHSADEIRKTLFSLLQTPVYQRSATGIFMCLTVLNVLEILNPEEFSSFVLFVIQLTAALRTSNVISCTVPASSNISTILVAFSYALASAGDSSFQNGVRKACASGVDKFRLPIPYACTLRNDFSYIPPNFLRREIQKGKFSKDSVVIFDYIGEEKAHKTLEAVISRFGKKNVLFVQYRHSRKRLIPGSYENKLCHVEYKNRLDVLKIAEYEEKYPNVFPLPALWPEIINANNLIWEMIIFPAIGSFLHGNLKWEDADVPLAINPSSTSFLRLLGLSIAGEIFHYAISFEHLFSKALISTKYDNPSHYIIIKVLTDASQHKHIISLICQSIFILMSQLFIVPLTVFSSTQKFIFEHLMSDDYSPIFSCFMPLLKTEEESTMECSFTMSTVSMSEESSEKEESRLSSQSTEESDAFSSLGINEQEIKSKINDNHHSFLSAANNNLKRLLTDLCNMFEYQNDSFFSSVIVPIENPMRCELRRVFEHMVMTHHHRKMTLHTQNVITYSFLKNTNIDTFENCLFDSINEIKTLLRENQHDIRSEGKAFFLLDLTTLRKEELFSVNVFLLTIASIAQQFSISIVVVVLIFKKPSHFKKQEEAADASSPNLHSISSSVSASVSASDTAQTDAALKSKPEAEPVQMDADPLINNLELFNRYEGRHHSACPPGDDEGIFGNLVFPFLSNNTVVWKELSIARMLDAVNANDITFAKLGFETQNTKKMTNAELNEVITRNVFEDFFDSIVAGVSEEYSSLDKDYIQFFAVSVFIHTAFILRNTHHLPHEIFEFPPSSLHTSHDIIFSTGSALLDSVIAGFGRALRISPFINCGFFEMVIPIGLIFKTICSGLKIPRSFLPPPSSFKGSPLLEGTAFLRSSFSWSKIFWNGYLSYKDIPDMEASVLFRNQARVVFPLVQYLIGYRLHAECSDPAFVVGMSDYEGTSLVVKQAIGLAFGSSRRVFELKINDLQAESGSNQAKIEELFNFMSKAHQIHGLHDDYYGWEDPPVVIFSFEEIEELGYYSGFVSNFLNSLILHPFAQIALSINKTTLNTLISLHKSSVINSTMPEHNNTLQISEFIRNRIIPIVIIPKPKSGKRPIVSPNSDLLSSISMTSIFLVHSITKENFRSLAETSLKKILSDISVILPKHIEKFSKFKNQRAISLFKGVSIECFIETFEEKYLKLNSDNFLEIVLTAFKTYHKLKNTPKKQDTLRDKHVLITSLGVDAPSFLHTEYLNQLMIKSTLPDDEIYINVESDTMLHFPTTEHVKYVKAETLMNILGNFQNQFNKFLPLLLDYLFSLLSIVLYTSVCPAISETMQEMSKSTLEEEQRLRVDIERSFKLFIEKKANHIMEIDKLTELREKLQASKKTERTHKDRIKTGAYSKKLGEFVDAQNNLMFSSQSISQESMAENQLLVHYLNEIVRIFAGLPVGPANTRFFDLSTFSTHDFTFDDISIPLPEVPAPGTVELDLSKLSGIYDISPEQITPEILELTEPYVSNVFFSLLKFKHQQPGLDDFAEDGGVMQFINSLCECIFLVIDCANYATQNTAEIRRNQYSQEIIKLSKEVVEQTEIVEAQKMEVEQISNERKHSTEFLSDVTHQLESYNNAFQVIQKLIVDSQTIAPSEQHREELATTVINVFEFSLLHAFMIHDPYFYLTNEEEFVKQVIKPVYYKPSDEKLISIKTFNDNSMLDAYESDFKFPSSFLLFEYSPWELAASGIYTTNTQKLFSLALSNTKPTILFDPHDIAAPAVFYFFPNAALYLSIEDFIQDTIASFNIEEIEKADIELFKPVSALVVNSHDLLRKTKYGDHLFLIAQKIYNAWPNGPKMLLICREEKFQREIPGFSRLTIPMDVQGISYFLATRIHQKVVMKATKTAHEITKIQSAKETSFAMFANQTWEIIHNIENVMDLVRSPNFIPMVKRLLSTAEKYLQKRDENITVSEKMKEIIDLFVEFSRSYFIPVRIMMSTTEAFNSLRSSEITSFIDELTTSYANESYMVQPQILTTGDIMYLGDTVLNHVYKNQGKARKSLSNNLFFKENTDVSLILSRLIFWIVKSSLPSSHHFSYALFLALKLSAPTELCHTLLEILLLEDFNNRETLFFTDLELLFAIARIQIPEGQHVPRFFRELILRYRNQETSTQEIMTKRMDVKTQQSDLPYSKELQICLKNDLFFEYGLNSTSFLKVQEWEEWAAQDTPLQHPTPLPIINQIPKSGDFSRVEDTAIVTWLKAILAIVFCPKNKVQFLLDACEMATLGIVNINIPGLSQPAREDRFDCLNTDSDFFSTIPSYFSFMDSSRFVLHIPSSFQFSLVESCLPILQKMDPLTLFPLPKIESVLIVQFNNEEIHSYYEIQEIVQRPVVLVVILPSCKIHMAHFFGLMSSDLPVSYLSDNGAPWWLPLASPSTQEKFINKDTLGIEVVNQHPHFRLVVSQSGSSVCPFCKSLLEARTLSINELNVLGRSSAELFAKLTGRTLLFSNCIGKEKSVAGTFLDTFVMYNSSLSTKEDFEKNPKKDLGKRFFSQIPFVFRTALFLNVSPRLNEDMTSFCKKNRFRRNAKSLNVGNFIKNLLTAASLSDASPAVDFSASAATVLPALASCNETIETNLGVDWFSKLLDNKHPRFSHVPASAHPHDILQTVKLLPGRYQIFSQTFSSCYVMNLEKFQRVWSSDICFGAVLFLTPHFDQVLESLADYFNINVRLLDREVVFRDKAVRKLPKKLPKGRSSLSSYGESSIRSETESLAGEELILNQMQQLKEMQTYQFPAPDIVPFLDHLLNSTALTIQHNTKSSLYSSFARETDVNSKNLIYIPTIGGATTLGQFLSGTGLMMASSFAMLFLQQMPMTLPVKPPTYKFQYFHSEQPQVTPAGLPFGHIPQEHEKPPPPEPHAHGRSQPMHTRNAPPPKEPNKEATVISNSCELPPYMIPLQEMSSFHSEPEGVVFSQQHAGLLLAPLMSYLALTSRYITNITQDFATELRDTMRSFNKKLTSKQIMTHDEFNTGMTLLMNRIPDRWARAVYFPGSPETERHSKITASEFFFFRLPQMTTALSQLSVFLMDALNPQQTPGHFHISTGSRGCRVCPELPNVTSSVPQSPNAVITKLLKMAPTFFTKLPFPDFFRHSLSEVLQRVHDGTDGSSSMFFQLMFNDKRHAPNDAVAALPLPAISFAMLFRNSTEVERVIVKAQAPEYDTSLSTATDEIVGGLSFLPVFELSHAMVFKDSASSVVRQHRRRSRESCFELFDSEGRPVGLVFSKAARGAAAELEAKDGASTMRNLDTADRPAGSAMNKLFFAKICTEKEIINSSQYFK